MKQTNFNAKYYIVLGIIFLLAIIAFEAFQQLFYVQRFDLGNSDMISVFELLKGQTYRWGIWLLFVPILWVFSKKKSVKIKFSGQDLLQYIFLIIGLVIIAIMIISFIALLNNNEVLNQYFSNYLPFFIFQKGLVFLLAYTGLAVISYQYLINKKLQIKVQELHAVKKDNIGLYKKLKNKIDDSSKVLNIKIGNKHKIIPIATISWIESDDYCVKIHTNDAISYSMRSTLKSMEGKLKSYNFLRVHRNALVNMKMAKEIDFSNYPKLILSDLSEISISKSKIKSVKDFLS